MSSSGTVPLSAIWAMLALCAPGYTKQQKNHNWIIRYKDRTYPRLPLGPHGKRVNPDIQIGHVKTMVRHLGIEECAKQHIAALR